MPKFSPRGEGENPRNQGVSRPSQALFYPLGWEKSQIFMQCSVGSLPTRDSGPVRSVGRTGPGPAAAGTGRGSRAGSGVGARGEVQVPPFGDLGGFGWDGGHLGTPAGRSSGPRGGEKWGGAPWWHSPVPGRSHRSGESLSPSACSRRSQCAQFLRSRVREPGLVLRQRQSDPCRPVRRTDALRRALAPRRHRHPQALSVTHSIRRRADSTARLRSHDRQLAVDGLGGEQPTLFLSNNFVETARALIIRYARRNGVEDGLDTRVNFIHLDCLASEVRLNVRVYARG
jgi:hypothetical protein